ncbi:MAG: RNA methyltransferase [Candidatus Promineifilaceae bacterium]|nr:RNA methyltransferase [Candidatus Promineifilaceae bacterium]
MITSVRNPLIRRIRRLRHKKHRQREGVFFVEGIRPVLAAVETGAAVETIVYAEGLLTSELAWTMLAHQRTAGTEVVALSPDVFAAISERENPVGLGAVVRTGITALGDLPAVSHGLYVALFDVGEPGNLGTIVRTVDAVGGSGIILVGQTVDAFHPTAVKASMGALFTVPIGQVEAGSVLLRWAADRGLQTVATSAQAPVSFWTASYHPPVLLMMGSEGPGLDPAIRAAADLQVAIPMYGAATSLNLAVATGVLLYDYRRRN